MLTKITRVLIPIVVVGMLAVFIRNIVNRYQAYPEKLNLVKALTEQIPLHPSFREIKAPQQIVTFETVNITRSFKSDVDFGVVKQYYLAQLLPQQWKLVGEEEVDWGSKKLEFIKGEFFFSVRFERKTFGPEYSLGYNWDSPDFRSRIRHLPLN
jgi:hypothetical protein